MLCRVSWWFGECNSALSEEWYGCIYAGCQQYTQWLIKGPWCASSWLSEDEWREQDCWPLFGPLLLRGILFSGGAPLWGPWCFSSRQVSCTACTGTVLSGGPCVDAVKRSARRFCSQAAPECLEHDMHSVACRLSKEPHWLVPGFSFYVCLGMELNRILLDDTYYASIWARAKTPQGRVI